MRTNHFAGRGPGFGPHADLPSSDGPAGPWRHHPHRSHGHGHDDEPGGRRERHGRRGGFGPGGPDFGGFGAGFGPRGRGPRRGGGRRAARGDVRASVLALVAEQPMHGYQIITELAQRSAGAWQPSPGSVYPVLQQLADEGLVRIEETDGRRVVHLTEEGKTYVAGHQAELHEPWAAVAGEPDEPAQALGAVARQVAAATWQVAQAGSDAQLAQARDILAEARRSLYRILAEDEQASSPTE